LFIRDSTYAPRYKSVVRAAIYEARTGKQIAHQTFTGSTPHCPSTISVYGGDPGSVDGDTPRGIDAWVHRYH
jgi:hypothetical protein